MIEGDVATSVDDASPSVGVSDATSRDRDDHDDVTDDEDAFVAGFRACGREALRYLRERDVPVISEELERHLADVERICRQSDTYRPAAADDSALGVSLVDDEDGVVSTTDDLLHGQSELSDSAHELLRLAQNNPRINNILNELFTLMDDDDDDDDDDDCMMTCDDDDVMQRPSSRDTMTSRDAVSDVS